MQEIHNRFKKIMVANRGEIAIRVLRAGHELGLTTVAMFTYEDRYSLHRYKADESYQIGSNDEPLRPYLDVEEIIRVAKMNGVDAIHPGYGFLSENVNFARRCREEGITFIGPTPETMERLVAWLNQNINTASGRTYAGGLTKFEPKEIERLRIPSPARLQA